MDQFLLQDLSHADGFILPRLIPPLNYEIRDAAECDNELESGV